jgi:hypothetical protein
MSNLGWIKMVNQTIKPINMNILIRKILRLPIDQRNNNKVYYKGPNDWFYEIENKKIF